MEHEVSGRVMIQETRIPVAGVTVDIWRRSLFMDRLVTSLETGADGSFVTRVSRGLLSKWLSDEIYLRVWNGDEHELHDGTEQPRVLRQPREDIEVAIPLADIASEQGVSLMREVQPRVTGRMTYVDAEGVALPEWTDAFRERLQGLSVQLWDAERQVRLAVEDAARGAYQLWFSTEAHPRVRLIQVRVVSRAGPAVYEGPIMGWCHETLQHDLTIVCERQ